VTVEAIQSGALVSVCPAPYISARKRGGEREELYSYTQRSLACALFLREFPRASLQHP